MEFSFSEFLHEEDTLPNFEKWEWETFAERLSEFPVREQKNFGRLWSPALYVIGERRAKVSVSGMSALVYDFDGVTEDFVEGLKKRLVDFECLIHSTFSHLLPGKGSRYRLVVPFERNFSVPEWKVAYKAVAKTYELEGLRDKAAGHEAVPFFWPSKSSEEAPTVFWRHKGAFFERRWLDVIGDVAAETLSEPIVVSAPEGVVTGEKLEGAEKGRQLGGLWSSLRLSRAWQEPERKALYDQLREGKPLASVGARDRTLYSVLSKIVFTLSDEHVANLDEDVILDLIQKSLDATPGEGEDRLTREDAREKLRRVRSECIQKRESDKVNFKNWQSEPKQETAEEAPPPPPLLTDDEYRQRCIETAGGDKDPVWLVSFKKSLYVLAPDGYRGPYTQQDFWGVVEQTLVRAGISVTKVSKNGAVSQLTVHQILQNVGATAESLVYTYLQGKTSFDRATRQLTVSVCHRDESLVPTFNPAVDAWLRCFSGEAFERLCDWLATCRELERPTSLLYFEGPPKTGKTLFAFALASLWENASPTDAAMILGSNFNATLLESPLILADEKMPGGRGELSSQLRTLVSVYEREINRKFEAVAKLQGCIRLILTANNDRALSFDETLTSDDADAVAQRVFHIQVDASAENFLKDLPTGAIETWVKGKAFARHVLWLEQTRDVKKGERFLVEGSRSELIAEFQLSGLNGRVAEFLVKGVMKTFRLSASDSNSEVKNFRKCVFLDSKNRLRVSQGVFQCQTLWKELVIETSQRHNTSSLRRALKALRAPNVKESEVHHNPEAKCKVRSWEMSEHLLLEACEQNDLDSDEFLECLGKEPEGGDDGELKFH